MRYNPKISSTPSAIQYSNGIRAINGNSKSFVLFCRPPEANNKLHKIFAPKASVNWALPIYSSLYVEKKE